MTDIKKKRGRPTKSPGKYVEYQRIAVNKSTYLDMKKLANDSDLPLIDWITIIVNNLKK